MLNQYNFDTMCISGGGTKGICFLGAIKALIDLDIIDLKNIKTFIGTSIGGIICFLLSINFTINELIEFVESFNFELLVPSIDIECLISECGIDRGDKLNFLLTTFLKEKTNKNDMTLMEHYLLTNKKLILSVTNYSSGTTEYLSYENYPNISILLACKMSACLPLYFVPIRIKECDIHKYQNKNSNNISDKEIIFIDGGVLDNFPIQLGNVDTTIGILLNDPTQTYNTNSIPKFISSIIGMITNFTICYKLNDNQNIIHIKVDDMEIVKFKMSKKFKKKLINNGYLQTLEYYKKSIEKTMQTIINDIIDEI